MKTQYDQSEIKINESTQVKKDYQMPILNEYGLLVDLTAGGTEGTDDGNMTGTWPK